MLCRKADNCQLLNMYSIYSLDSIPEDLISELGTENDLLSLQLGLPTDYDHPYLSEFLQDLEDHPMPDHLIDGIQQLCLGKVGKLSTLDVGKTESIALLLGIRRMIREKSLYIYCEDEDCEMFYIHCEADGITIGSTFAFYNEAKYPDRR